MLKKHLAAAHTARIGILIVKPRLKAAPHRLFGRKTYLFKPFLRQIGDLLSLSCTDKGPAKAFIRHFLYLMFYFVLRHIAVPEPERLDTASGGRIFKFVQPIHFLSSASWAFLKTSLNSSFHSSFYLDCKYWSYSDFSLVISDAQLSKYSCAVMLPRSTFWNPSTRVF